MKKTIVSTIIATTLASIILLTGCGSSNNTPTTKLPTVGISQIAHHSSLDNCRNGFIEGLKQSGYIDGETVTIDYQNAQNEPSTAATIASNFVSKKYDLICGIATPSAMSAAAAADRTTTPVVFCAVSDPVSAKLADSIDIPGKNATGTTDTLPLEAQMKMIRSFLPNAKKIGILYTLSEPNSKTHLDEFTRLAPTYGFEIVPMGVNTSSDIPLAVDSLLSKVDCINNFTDNNVVTNLDIILEKANAKNIPVFGSEEEQVKNGCVGSQGIDYFKLGVETGKMAASLLKDKTLTPATMPIKVVKESQPYINKAALKKLNIAIPEEFANATNLEKQIIKTED